MNRLDKKPDYLGEGKRIEVGRQSAVGPGFIKGQLRCGKQVSGVRCQKKMSTEYDMSISRFVKF
ncbi:MAG: hypothetical protein JRK53_13100 [Deltaproteobacteria bacterium]|nr:hypothetical protein [Deltaproteobacteria bacterium]